MSKISQETLKAIKQKNIQPKPKWHFLLKDSVLWTLFGITLVVGGLAVSAFLFHILNVDYDIYREAQRGPVSHFLLSLPYLWMLLLVLLLGLSMYNMRHTRKGYRFKTIFVWAASILGSLVIGVVLFAVGLGAALDDRAGELLPGFEGFEERREHIFEDNEGLLAGTIIELMGDEEFILEAFDGEEWIIRTNEETKTGPLELEEGIRVGLIGEVEEEGIFDAEAIRPWDDGPGRGGPLGKKKPPIERKLVLPRTSE